MWGLFFACFPLSLLPLLVVNSPHSKWELAAQEGACKSEGLYAPVWRGLLRGNPRNSPEVWRYTGRSDVTLEWWIRHTSLLQRYVADPCKTSSTVSPHHYGQNIQYSESPLLRSKYTVQWMPTITVKTYSTASPHHCGQRKFLVVMAFFKFSTFPTPILSLWVFNGLFRQSWNGTGNWNLMYLNVFIEYYVNLSHYNWSGTWNLRVG